jgi:signal peptide peptidase SppA
MKARKVTVDETKPLAGRARGARRVFNKRGPLLMAKAFWGLDFFVDAPAPDLFREVDGVAIVDVCGPLTHHDEFSWWGGFESYDAILERVRAALASKCKSLVLCIDSPGGDVAGCFETARAIREEAAAAGKPVFAYVDGMAASGGYALACAATTIAAPETAFVGSIGVIETALDVTAQDAMYGERFTIVTSGARKADGNPHVQISDATIAAIQTDVDSLAAIFFRWVSEARGVSVDEIAALEAGIFHGERALAAKLIDVIVDEKGLLAMAASGKTGPTADNERKPPMGWKEDMYKAAEGGDEDAKSAIAHLAEKEPDGDEEKKADAADGDGDGDEKKEPKSEAEPDGDEKKKATARRSASVAAPVRELASVVRASVQSEVSTALAAERKRLEVLARVDARPDLTPEKKATLKSKKTEAIVEHLDLLGDPKPGVNLAAAATVGVTLGDGVRDEARGDRMPKAQADELDERMGLAKPVSKIFAVGTKRFFPSIDKAEAKAVLERNNKIDAAAAAQNGGK